jgi:hypothetical protein
MRKVLLWGPSFVLASGILVEAAMERRKTEFVYRKQDGITTLRRVMPVAVVRAREAVYLVAWDELRYREAIADDGPVAPEDQKGFLRSFRLDRIRGPLFILNKAYGPSEAIPSDAFDSEDGETAFMPMYRQEASGSFEDVFRLATPDTLLGLLEQGWRPAPATTVL